MADEVPAAPAPLRSMAGLGPCRGCAGAVGLTARRGARSAALASRRGLHSAAEPRRPLPLLPLLSGARACEGARGGHTQLSGCAPRHQSPGAKEMEGRWLRGCHVSGEVTEVAQKPREAVWSCWHWCCEIAEGRVRTDQFRSQDLSWLDRFRLLHITSRCVRAFFPSHGPFPKNLLPSQKRTSNPNGSFIAIGNCQEMTKSIQ